MVTGQIPVPVLEKGLDRQNHELMEEQQQLESVLVQADSLVLMLEGRLAFMAIPLPSPSLLLLSPLFLPSLPLPFSHKPDKPHNKGRQAREKHFNWSKASMQWDQGDTFTALLRPGDGAKPCRDEAGHEGSDGLQQAAAGKLSKAFFHPGHRTGENEGLGPAIYTLLLIQKRPSQASAVF